MGGGGWNKQVRRGVLNFDKIKIKGLFVNISATDNKKVRNCRVENVMAFNNKTIRNMH